MYVVICSIAFGLLGMPIGLLLGRVLPRKPPKLRCVGDLCDAFRYAECSDGRCRYHCKLFCQCDKTPISVWAAPSKNSKADRHWN